MLSKNKDKLINLRSITIYGGVLLIAAGFFVVNLFAPLYRYDESIMLLNSSNILQGLIPYKEFWTLYIPGYYYFLAGFFHLFGASTLPARIVDLCFRLAITCEIYLVDRKSVV